MRASLPAGSGGAQPAITGQPAGQASPVPPVQGYTAPQTQPESQPNAGDLR